MNRAKLLATSVLASMALFGVTAATQAALYAQPADQVAAAQGAAGASPSMYAANSQDDPRLQVGGDQNGVEDNARDDQSGIEDDARNDF